MTDFFSPRASQTLLFSMASAYICTKIGISTVHITETCATRFLSLNDKEKFRSISRVDVALEFFSLALCCRKAGPVLLLFCVYMLKQIFLTLTLLLNNLVPIYFQKPLNYQMCAWLVAWIRLLVPQRLKTVFPMFQLIVDCDKNHWTSQLCKTLIILHTCCAPFDVPSLLMIYESTYNGSMNFDYITSEHFQKRMHTTFHFKNY